MRYSDKPIGLCNRRHLATLGTFRGSGSGLVTKGRQQSQGLWCAR